MSSDSELEPTPTKRRRHTQLRSSNNGSGISVVAQLRNAQTNKRAGENEDVIVLSDIEIDAASQRGSRSCGSNGNSGSSFTDTSPLDELPETSKRSSESIENLAKEEPAGSSTRIDSDAYDIEAEKCPICYLPFTNQEVANPSTCDHRFCFHCIIEWTKTINTCPVDRLTFNDINVRPKFGSNVTRLVPVETRVRTDVEDAELDSDSDAFGIFEDEREVSSPVNESSVELNRTSSIEETEDNRSLDMFSASNDNYDIYNTSPEVVAISSSDEEVHSWQTSECNNLSSSSTSNEPYFNVTPLSSPYFSPSRSSPVVPPSSSSSPFPSHSSSPLPSPLSSHLSSPPSSPLILSSPSPLLSPSASSSSSISSSVSRSQSPILSSPSLTVSSSRLDLCSSLSNASSASAFSSSY